MQAVFNSPYIPRFAAETAPAWLTAARHRAGHDSHDLARPFRYLDLGCGYGQSLSIFAHTHPHAHFTGIDIQPDHITSLEARRRDWKLQNLDIRAQSFADFIVDPGGPWDFVILDGIWSWTDESTRSLLANNLSSLIAPGGILYLNYNLTPGWQVLDPALHFYHQNAEQIGEDAAFNALLQTSHQPDGWFARHPSARALVNRLAAGDIHWRQQELGPTRRHFWHSHIAAQMASAGLVFADNLEPDSGAPLPADAEDRRDFDQNRYFRRDVFIDPRPPAYIAAPKVLDDLPSSGLSITAPPECHINQPDGGLILPGGFIGNGISLSAEETCYWNARNAEQATRLVHAKQLTLHDDHGHILDDSDIPAVIATRYAAFQMQKKPWLLSLGVAEVQ